jgi:hypothetical protein
MPRNSANFRQPKQVSTDKWNDPKFLKEQERKHEAEEYLALRVREAPYEN